MTSKTPAPSKAALHALRGLVFTTSCTVALLAEERRRRTKLARTAIDNARKLHTVKARQNSTSLLDAGFTPDDLYLLTIHRAIESPKRARRREARRNAAAKSHNTDRNPNQVTCPERISTSRPFAHVSPATSPPSSTTVPSHQSPEVSAEQGAGLGLQQSSTAYLDDQSQLPLQSPSAVPEPHRSAFAVRRETVLAQAKTQIQAQPTPFGQPVPSSIVNSLASSSQVIEPIESKVENYLSTGPRVSSRGHVCHRDALPLLEDLLTSMEATSMNDLRYFKQRDLAIAVFEKAIASNPKQKNSITTRSLRRYALRLIKTMINLDATSLASTIDILMPLYNSLSQQLLVPLFQWLAEQNNISGLRKLVKFLAAKEVDEGAFASDWVSEVIRHHAVRYQNSADTRRLYKMLSDCAISTDRETKKRRDYDLHSALLELAIKEDNSNDCHAQRQELRKIDYEREQLNERSQQISLLADIEAGRCKSGHEALIRMDCIQSPDDRDSRAFVVKMADASAKYHSPRDLEVVVRHLTKQYGLKLRPRWVYPVLDHYSKHVDLEAMLSWVEFCIERGFGIQDEFMQKFYVKCRQHWRASDQELTKLYHGVHALGPGFTWPQIVPRENTDQPLISTHQPFKLTAEDEPCSPSAKIGETEKGTFSAEDWETMYIRSSSRISPKSVIDDTLFSSMQVKARDGKWEQVCAAFDQVRTSNQPYSIRCLRLAILARVKLDGGAASKARQLLSAATVQGYDVTEALTPVLMAEVNAGQKPIMVLQASLSQGYKIHDMVYNRAAGRASSEGDHHSAVDICKIAAAENGGGDLLYNIFNFTNLVFSYTSLGSYGPLTSLLAEFTNEKRWWSSSKACKYSIKLAMKTVAKRAALSRNRNEARYHEAVLLNLEEAFHFGSECIVSRSHRAAMIDGFVEMIQRNIPVQHNTAIRGPEIGASRKQPENPIRRASSSKISARPLGKEAGHHDQISNPKANPVQVSVPVEMMAEAGAA